MNKFLLFLFLGTITVFTGCLKNSDETAQSREIIDRSNYLTELQIYINSLSRSSSYTRIDTTFYPRLDPKIYRLFDKIYNTHDTIYYVRLDTGYTNKVAFEPGTDSVIRYSTIQLDQNFIYANVTGSLINGNVFETNSHTLASKNGLSPSNTYLGPLFFRIDSLSINGLIEGLPKMKLGALYKFVIPSALGFGASSANKVPSYATLVYDIQLVKIISDPVAYDKYYMNKWVDSLKLKPVTNSSGTVYVKVDSISSGDTLKDGDQVKVLYKGKFLDLNVYFTDSTKYDSVTFTLGQNQVIKGWELALHNLRDSCKAEIIVPYDMAYQYGLKNSNSNVVIPEYHSLYYELNKIVWNK